MPFTTPAHRWPAQGLLKTFAVAKAKAQAAYKPSNITTKRLKFMSALVSMTFKDVKLDESCYYMHLVSCIMLLRLTGVWLSPYLARAVV